MSIDQTVTQWTIERLTCKVKKKVIVFIVCIFRLNAGYNKAHKQRRGQKPSSRRAYYCYHIKRSAGGTGLPTQKWTDSQVTINTLLVLILLFYL